MKIDVNNITPRQKLIIEKGLCDYKYIMDYWKTNDKDFQDIYYDFYMRSRWALFGQKGFKNLYFQKMQEVKPNEELVNILDFFAKKGKKSNEFSLSTKLLHTINPSKPIYDSKIRNYLMEEKKVNFWWQVPKKVSGAPKKITERDMIAHDWKELCQWYDSFKTTQEYDTWIKWFKDNFPSYSSISDVKKIDFIIFALN